MSLATAGAIAYYTVREMVRRKLLIFFAAGGLLLSVALGLFVALAPSELLQGAQTRALFLVLTSGVIAGFFLFLTALGIGSTTIYHDLESGSAVMIFSKPLSRLEYTAGKVVAAVGMLGAVTAVIAVGIFIVLELAGGGHEDLLARDFARVFANQLTIMLIVLMLTAVTNNIVAIVAGWVTVNVANFVNALYAATRSQAIPDGWNILLSVLHWVLPRQLQLNVVAELIRVRGAGTVAPPELTSDWTDILYWAGYIVVLLCVLYLLVRRRQA